MTDQVAVGTVSGEGLSPVFPERAPCSIMDESNKAREHKKAQEEHRCGQIAPHGSAERLRCVDARLCLGVKTGARKTSQCVNARMCTSYGPTAARTVSGLQACTRCVEAGVTNPLARTVLEGCGRYCQGWTSLWWVADGRARK